MGNKQNPTWPWLFLLVFISGACSGVLAEQELTGGKVERIRVEGTQSWKSWDPNPKREDGGGIILKKESTF